MESACIESAGKIGRAINSRLHRYMPSKHKKYSTQLQHCVDKFHQVRYSNSLDFLFAVSHFTDNVVIIVIGVTM